MSETSCIISWWRIDKDGYGKRTIVVDGHKTTELHHRRALEQKLGRQLSPNMIACHTRIAGGHLRSCVRPDHLYEGTYSQNKLDSGSDGTDPNLNKTHCPAGHEYSDINTYVYPRGARSCRQCHNARQREYSARKRAERKGRN